VSRPYERERFPVEPLLALVGAGWEVIERNGGGVQMVGADRRLARAVGVSTRTVYRRKHTGLCPWAADRWAVALGRHPGDVWPEWSIEEQPA
jgi:hypothetical protein